MQNLRAFSPADHNVVRFDVPMDDILVMEPLDTVQQLVEHHKCSFKAELMTTEL